MASDYRDFSQVVKDSACTMLHDPGAVSEIHIAEALGHGRAKDVNLQEAKELFEDYLTLLCSDR